MEMTPELRQKIFELSIKDGLVEDIKELDDVSDQILLLYYETKLYVNGEIKCEKFYEITDDLGKTTISHPILAYINESYDEAVKRETLESENILNTSIKK